MTTERGIKKYWNDRAKKSPATATTDDIWLRHLEISTITAKLRELYLLNGSCNRILDVGCGDGKSTMQIAANLPKAHIIGIDYAPNMIKLAGKISSTYKTTFQIDSILNTRLANRFKSFDAVISMRSLINLQNEEAQKKAFANIARVLKPGGYYIGSENFIGGQNTLNGERIRNGLPEIPIRWHNCYFDEYSILEIAYKNFDYISLDSYASAYYYATRIVYAKTCQQRGHAPNYASIEHACAVDLEPMGDFSPVKLIVLRKMP